MKIGTRRSVRAVALGAASVLIAAGCVGTQTSPGFSAEPSSTAASFDPVTPSATPELTLATRSARPVASLLPPPALAWTVLLKTGGPVGIVGAVATADAYIAYGGDASGSWAARSTDGRTWISTRLSTSVKACPTYAVAPDFRVYAGATDGRQVVLGGVESACGTYSAVAWISSDGKSWQRSEEFGAVDGFAEATEVWAVPGGWESLVQTSTTTGTRSIWASTDGLQWRRTRIATAAPGGDLSATFGVATDGTRLLSRFNGATDTPVVVDGLGGGESSLERSTDGVVWSSVALNLPKGRGVGGIWPPGLVGPNQWLLLTVAESLPVIMWVSADLVDWRQAQFPRGDFGLIAATRYGYFVTGANLCGDGGTCSPNELEYFSADGLQWTPFTDSTAYYIVVDGPAGVIGLNGAEVGYLGQ